MYFSRKLENQILLEEARGCARPADTVWWGFKSASHCESCLLSNSFVFSTKTWERTRPEHAERTGISAFCAPENQEHGVMTAFRSYRQENSCGVRAGPGWQVQNALHVLFLLGTPCVCTSQGLPSSASLPCLADPAASPPVLEKQGCKTQGAALEIPGTGKSYGWTYWCQPTICPGCCDPEGPWEREKLH